MEGTTEKSQTNDAQLTSAAAFVDGGIQDSCDDACSICLESFCESDPSTLTSCEHEFHLQCILEWSQRSSQCPMCWQPISLKDPTSQELLEAIEKERSSRFNPSRNATIFHHPNLGDFEPQHLPVGVDNSELEERIIQHLAAAAAMRRARHTARREGHRTNRSSAQSHLQFLMFSSHSESSSPHTPMPSSPLQSGDGEPTSTITVGTPPSSTAFREESPVNSNAHHVVFPASGFSVLSGNEHGTILNNRRSPSQSSLSAQNRAGAEPPVLQPFPESLKSRLNAVSMRYKESISRSTRSWKDKFFSRNTSMTDLGSEVRIEVNAGIATVSRMMESLEIKDSSSSPVMASVSPRLENQTPTGSNNQTRSEADAETSLNRAGVHGTSAAASGMGGRVMSCFMAGGSSVMDSFSWE